jgi:flagella basal body P-ring formation protein FlgA
MKCSRRSTTSPGSAGRLLVAACLFAGHGVLAGGHTLATEDSGHEGVRAAIEQAVRARFDGAVAVHIEELRVTFARNTGAGPLTATPDPGARLGRTTRFALRRTSGMFAGEAACRLRVETTIARAARDLRRGRVLDDRDVEIARGSLSEGPLKRPPVEVVGARVTRDVAAGAILTAPMLVVAPLVRSGETVTAVVRMGSMEARARGVASQNGDLGELIRVVNPESRRAFLARVVGRGRVEVFHGS